MTGLDEMQPAGSYTVKMEEEPIAGLSSPAWKRIATVMEVARGKLTGYVKIDPRELSGALLRDGAEPAPPPAGRQRPVNAKKI